MHILRYVLLWLLSFIFTSLIDAAWHLVIFKKPYVEGLKPLARMKGAKMALAHCRAAISRINLSLMGREARSIRLITY